MAFPEDLKKEVRRKAAFRCCRCQEIGIQVHHIIPEAQDGPDTFENAAPLCAKCHDDFGDNAPKRKQIREMRDWWYEIVEKRFHPEEKQFEHLEHLNLKIDEYRKEQKEDIGEIKLLLKQYSDFMIDSATPDTLITTASGVTSTGFDAILIKEPFIITPDGDEGETS